MMRIMVGILMSGIVLAGPNPSAGLALQPRAEQQALDPSAVVAEVRRVIAARYVLPERRPTLDAALARGLASGRYAVADPGRLADLINEDLETTGRDRHLNFNHNPRAAADLAAGPQGAPDQAAFERQARGANHGVSELRILPGNVRYLAYDQFIWTGAESAAALDAAMRFLAGGEAAIIDLRRNGGGSPEAVQYMISHFLPAGRPLVTFHMNGAPSPDTLAALPDLPAGRMVGKPLYVLTSGGTGSAAEEFAGHVGGYRIGELVGATTNGAGFRNDLVPIPGGFVLSVSVGRAVLASTGRDWEAVGIAPTLPTEVGAALDRAHLHALRRLAAAASPPEAARLTGIAEALAARGEARAPALPLTAYAGSYGERAMIAEGGRLFYLRAPTRARAALIPLGGNAFALETDPAMRVRFQAEGERAASFEMAPVGAPSAARYARTR